MQTDVGKRIDESLAGIIIKKTHDRESGSGDATPHFRLGVDRKLRVRTPSTTDPKQISEDGGYYALFQGIFDLQSKKWLATDARALKQDEYNATETAFGNLDIDLQHTSFATEESKAEWLDDRMNEVYLVARLILPPARFATVKKEQVEWLKKRDSASSVNEKHKLVEARIKALQELLW